MERLEEKAKQEQAKKEEESTKAPGAGGGSGPGRVKRDGPRTRASPPNTTPRSSTKTRKYGKFDRNELQRSRGDSDRNQAAVAEQPQRARPSHQDRRGALAMRTPAHRRPSALSTPGDPERALASQTNGTRDLRIRRTVRCARRRWATSNRATGARRRPLLSPGPGLASLLPSEEEIARSVGSGTQDHLRDVDEGEETALNAKRWKLRPSSTGSKNRYATIGGRTKNTGAATPRAPSTERRTV